MGGRDEKKVPVACVQPCWRNVGEATTSTYVHIRKGCIWVEAMSLGAPQLCLKKMVLPLLVRFCHK
jgi:hypothetical protein